MKKVLRYIIIFAWIIFFTGIVVCLFNLRIIYKTVVVPGIDRLPESWQVVIDKISHRQKKEAVVYRPERSARILEGWTSGDIANYLAEQDLIEEDDFFSFIGQAKTDYRSLPASEWPLDLSSSYGFLSDKPKYFGLEGFLFPDTYRFHASSTASEIVFKMLDNFDSKLTDQMRRDIAAQGRSIYEVVTMASLVEKEAPFLSTDKENRDARLIAGIFWYRLKIGQALQSDATLSYLFNDNNPSHSGAELSVDSPYNSYKYPGLPPTPICNPGLLALQAAIYPLDSDYNYFLTPKNSRQVIFAKSYQEHLANKAKYLR